MERNPWSKSSTILPLFSSERSFDLLVDTRKQFNVFFFTVTCIWVEEHKLQRHNKQSYLGEINDSYDTIAKIIVIKESSVAQPN